MELHRWYTGSFIESSFPVLDGFVVVVFFHCFPVNVSAVSYVWWIHFVEHGYHCQALRFSAVQYFHQLIQAPLWINIAFRENHNCKLWVVDCFGQWRPNLVSFIKVVVIHECFDVVSGESGMKVVWTSSHPGANKNMYFAGHDDGIPCFVIAMCFNSSVKVFKVLDWRWYQSHLFGLFVSRCPLMKISWIFYPLDSLHTSSLRGLQMGMNYYSCKSKLCWTTQSTDIQTFRLQKQIRLCKYKCCITIFH